MGLASVCRSGGADGCAACAANRCNGSGHGGTDDGTGRLEAERSNVTRPPPVTVGNGKERCTLGLTSDRITSRPLVSSSVVRYPGSRTHCVLRTQLRAAALASPSVCLSGRYSAHYRDYGIVYRAIGFRPASYAVLLLSRLGSRHRIRSRGDLEEIVPKLELAIQPPASAHDTSWALLFSTA